MKYRARVGDSTMGIEDILALSPGEFEGFVSNLLRKMGFNAETTRLCADGGVDVWASAVGISPEQRINPRLCRSIQMLVGNIRDCHVAHVVPSEHRRIQRQDQHQKRCKTSVSISHDSSPF